MAWSFGDSFDVYAAGADTVNGYWDVASTAPSSLSFSPGRFTGSQSLVMSTTTTLIKSSGVNDAVHHIVCSLYQNTSISGGSLYQNFQLFDGANAQCSVVFRSDGAILLTSGGPAGAVLATYTGAFPVTTTWYAFEIEIVIHNTNGSFAVRKNGNTSNDFTATLLNTRPVSTNNYANLLKVGSGGNSAQRVDDLFWKSDAASVPWIGDIRCYTRMPTTDVQAQFSRSPTNFLGQNNPGLAVGSSLTANNLRAAPLLAPTSGTLVSLVVQLNAGITGHIKMALYDSTGASGNAGALIASSVELTNPGAGLTTFAIIGSPVVQRGTLYWLAFWSDTGPVFVGGASTALAGSASAGNALALTYAASFPASFGTPTGTSGISGAGCVGMNVTPFNAGCVNESQQDATTSYVYDSNAGDFDLYNVSALPVTPSVILGVVTRSYMQKSDVGSRTAAVQLKSGATTIASPSVVLTTSGWLWAWRMDTVDPATGAAWIASAVSAVQIGPKVVT
jgi:hypothetical protein